MFSQILFLTIASILLQITEQSDLNISFFPSFGLCPEMLDKVSLVHPDNYWEIYVIKDGKLQYPFDFDDTRGVDSDKLDSIASMVPVFSQISKFRIWDGNQKEYKDQSHNIRIQNLGQQNHKSVILNSKQIKEIYNYNERIEDEEKNDSQYFYIVWSDKQEGDKGIIPHKYSIFVKDKNDSAQKETAFYINKKYDNQSHNSNFQVILKDIEIVNPLTQTENEYIYNGGQDNNSFDMQGDVMDIIFRVEEGSQIVQNVNVQRDGEAPQNFNDFVLHQFNEEYMQIGVQCSQKNIDEKDILQTFISLDLKGYETHILLIKKDCSKEDPSEILEQDIITNVINKIDQEIEQENKNESNYTGSEDEENNDNDDINNISEEDKKRKQKIKDMKDHPANQTIKNIQKKEKLEKLDQPKEASKNVSIQSNFAKKSKSKGYDVVNKGIVNQLYTTYNKKNQNGALQTYSENTDMVDFWVQNVNPSKQKQFPILIKPEISVLYEKDEENTNIAQPQVTIFGKRSPRKNELFKEGYYLLSRKNTDRIQVIFNCIQEKEILMNLKLDIRYPGQEFDEYINIQFKKRCIINEDQEEFVEESSDNSYYLGENVTFANYVYGILCCLALFLGCKVIFCLKKMIKTDSDISQQEDLEKMKRKYDKMDQLPDSSLVFRN